jgi:hypothetical protein
MEKHIEKLDEIVRIPILGNKALHHVFEHNMVPDDGLWIEFGTYDGRSVNKISRYTENDVYGFDSFEGLPEAWVGRHMPKGTFNLGGASSDFSLSKFFVYPNVKLFKGWFSDTLPKFISDNDKPISFMHVDSDIYSSAKDIFNNTYKNIKNGCIIVFDELIGYPNFEEHEWKAWWEFVDEYGIEFEWIGGNVGGEIIENNIIPKFGAGTPAEHVIVSSSEENVAVRVLNNPHYKF